MNMTNELDYTIDTKWSQNDQNFVATVKEFPSLSWLAKTKDEARDGMKILLKDTLHDLAENDEFIPLPR